MPWSIGCSTSPAAALPSPGPPVDGAPTPSELVQQWINNHATDKAPDGVAWGAVGKSVEMNNTVENIERLVKAARGAGLPVAVSPHYYYPNDKGWKFEGALEKLMGQKMLILKIKTM